MKPIIEIASILSIALVFVVFVLLMIGLFTGHPKVVAKEKDYLFTPVRTMTNEEITEMFAIPKYHLSQETYDKLDTSIKDFWVETKGGESK